MFVLSRSGAVLTVVLSSLLAISCSKENVTKVLGEEAVSDKCLSDSCEGERLLHVPSPEWQDQIVYFLMIDRFEDGDPSNNDQGVGIFDTTKESHYSGGDLRGIIDRIDYIKNLGATAVWTTPHIANMWWDPLNSYGGYHGYWARDFKAVDEHYGTLDDYKDLSHALHTRGMYLIQDVVVNHVGNYFGYDGTYDPSDVTKNFKRNMEAIPGDAPTQSPFHQVDLNNPEHRKADIYHWTPDIIDLSDTVQEQTYKTGALSDLNTSNPVVREALKDSFGFWVKETGVDAFRIDTVKYVEPEFYEDFLHADNGIEAIAKETGRHNFLSFGEVFSTSLPYQANGEKKLSKYSTSSKVKRITSPIGFPLYKEIGGVFAGGSPTKYLSFRLEAHMTEYYNPFLVTNFIDNHDVERFLAGGSIDGFKQAYALMMTVPGIPMIYQGDEQAFLEYRKAMFAGGYQNEVDSFDEQHTMFLTIQKLAEMRKANKVFSRGKIEILRDNPIGPGVFAFKRHYKGKSAYVVMNTSRNETLLNAMPVDIGPADVLFSLNSDEKIEFSEDLTLTKILAPRSILVFIGDQERELKTVTKSESQTDEFVEFETIEEEYKDQSVARISGRLDLIKKGTEEKLLRVIDGDLSRAYEFSTDSSGAWEAPLSVNDLGDKEHYVEIYSPSRNQVSEVRTYRVINSRAEIETTVVDPKGDDNGLSGKLTQPAQQSFSCEMDMTEASVRVGGTVLELELSMCSVSSQWSPANEFDHVAFAIYLDVKGREGIAELPLLNAKFPDSGTWDFAHSAYGWGNYLFSSNGSSVEIEGEKMGVAPQIVVDESEKTIRFTYQGKEFGVEDWSGAKLYLTTWDKDGGGILRGLAPNPGLWQFGGAEIDGPKVLDDMLIELP